MTAWRICKATHRASAFSGDGAARFPGRWNSAGRRVVYLGESRSLAALEILVHAGDLSLLAAMAWVAFRVDFDDALVAMPGTLPADWNTMPPGAGTRTFGDTWLDERRSLLLRVPSVVTKGEFNFLLNPLHPDFSRLKVGRPEIFRFDRRLGNPR